MSRTAVVHVLLVGAGGAFGSMLRYGVSGLVHRLLPAATFPYGTLAVNVLGCLVIGVVAGLMDARQVITPGTRAFLMLGVLGGFTTFSAFGHETHGLLREGQNAQVGANVLLSVGLCLFAVWIGHRIGNAW